MNRCINSLWIIVATFTATVASAAPDVAVQAVDVVGQGTFVAASATTSGGFTETMVPRDDVSGIRFIEYTHRIPMRPGTSFGVQYIVNSRPAGGRLQVTSVIKLPEPGMKRPGGRRYQEFRERHSIVIGRKTLHGYGFDEPWEQVPGTWTFEVWVQGSLMLSRSFEVYDESP